MTPHQFISSPEWEAHQITSHSHSGVPNGVPGVPNGVVVDVEAANHKPKPSDAEPVYQVKELGIGVSFALLSTSSVRPLPGRREYLLS